jgi:hypothetical protein
MLKMKEGYQRQTMGEMRDNRTKIKAEMQEELSCKD